MSTQQPTLGSVHGSLTASTGTTRPRWPDFFVIGAMKSGSTTLASHLANCKHLYVSAPKEPQFFSGGRFGRLGQDAYLQLFSAAPDTALCCDASTCYSRYPHYGEVPSRLARHCPNARLIYLLRDPADRVYSHYLHNMRRRWLEYRLPPKSFASEWQTNAEYLDTSRYMYQLQRYLEHFSSDQVFLCTTRELEVDPSSLVDRICEFLGTPPDRIKPLVHKRTNESLGHSFLALSARNMRARLRNSMLGRSLAPIVPAFVRRGFGRLAHELSITTTAQRDLRKFRGEISPYGEADRHELIEALRPSIEDLQDHWRHDLSAWMNPTMMPTPESRPARRLGK